MSLLIFLPSSCYRLCLRLGITLVHALHLRYDTHLATYKQLIFLPEGYCQLLSELSNHPLLSFVSSGEQPLSITYHNSSFYFQITVAATTPSDFRCVTISHGMPLLISSFKLSFDL